MRLKLDDIPERPAVKYPERIHVAVSPDTAKKLRYLKENGKDVPEFLRSILDSALEGIQLTEKKIS